MHVDFYVLCFCWLCRFCFFGGIVDLGCWDEFWWLPFCLFFILVHLSSCCLGCFWGLLSWFRAISGMGLGWTDGMFILVHRSTKSTLGSNKTHKLKVIIQNFLKEGSSRGTEPAEATFPSKLLSGIQFCINPIFLRIWLKLEGYLIKKRSWIKLRVYDEWYIDWGKTRLNCNWT